MNLVNTPEESDEEKEEAQLEADFCHTTRGTTQEKGATDFKVDIPTFEGKNDPDDFLEWLETVERVFDFKDVPEDKKVKIVALKFQKYASTWWSNLSTKRRRENKAPVKTWFKMRSLLKKKFLPEQYVRDNFAKLQHLRQDVLGHVCTVGKVLAKKIIGLKCVPHARASRFKLLQIDGCYYKKRGKNCRILKMCVTMNRWEIHGLRKFDLYFGKANQEETEEVESIANAFDSRHQTHDGFRISSFFMTIVMGRAYHTDSY
ncbi:unnamed protein product [Cuscuta campestris]|uniref:Retrotransposon gag domain-containing protein n=1 Tax=Cuscuta campestris TaxID=132261 RepID=A0A484NGW1_9ASTE|nr:unnamed protein product [Cuscuta campestris]